MFYRETGQFKTSYAADQQIFPVAQDRYAVLAFVAVAFFVVPFAVSDYTFQAVLIPFLIMALAALGLNILVGYCGQISLGTGAFMAVGAYAAYNLQARIEGMPLILALIGGGAIGAVAGIPVARALAKRATLARRSFAILVLLTAIYVAVRAL